MGRRHRGRTIPSKNLGDVPAAPVAGKIVIDTLNYYPQRDGHIAELDNEKTTTSEMVQTAFAGVESREGVQSHLRRGADNARPAGWLANRRALAIAGNDPAAKKEITALLERFGFDTVDIGPLSESWRIQRDTPGYGPRRTAEELPRTCAVAKRPPT